MRKLLLPLLFMAGTVNAASSVKEICTDYTKYLGHVYGFAVSQDESMRKKLLSDMKRLKLSEAMVQQELYKVATNENAKYQYSRLLNPDANEINRSSFDYMVKACETAPDFAIPSWGVLVASNAVNKEDVGRNGIDSIRNAPGMRHQNVQGTLEERARGRVQTPQWETSLQKNCKSITNGWSSMRKRHAKKWNNKRTAHLIPSSKV